MTTAFGYMRVSGKGQESGDGFDRQRLAIEKYAAASGITVVEWFQDIQTGRDEWELRPGWSKMIEAMNGTRTILVEKLDRVARRVVVQELILADLKKRDISLITSSGEDTSDDDLERTMFRQMLAVFSQYERGMIVLKLRGARQRIKAATGKCEGQKAYGDKPGEEEVLSFMKKARKDGLKLNSVVHELNIREMRTRKGNPWTVGAVHKILSRETQCAQK